MPQAPEKAKCPLEDRLAIEDLAIAYCTAVDTIGDIEGVCALFAENAVYDLTTLGMGLIKGRDAIAIFFAGMFPGMAHNAHSLSNFALVSYARDSAVARAYVHAISRDIDGGELALRARYHFTVARQGAAWVITRLGVDFLIPPG